MPFVAPSLGRFVAVFIMRWLWIDRIIELVPDTRLVAIKNVSLAEDYLRDHFAGAEGLDPMPVFPASLILEGMAQTAGILAGSARQFREKVILAKVSHAVLEFEVFPGNVLRYEAVLQRIDTTGAATTGTVRRFCPVAERWDDLGKIDLLFSHIDQSLTGKDIPKHNFVFGENLKIVMREVVSGQWSVFSGDE